MLELESGLLLSKDKDGSICYVVFVLCCVVLRYRDKRRWMWNGKVEEKYTKRTLFVALFCLAFVADCLLNRVGVVVGRW